MAVMWQLIAVCHLFTALTSFLLQHTRSVLITSKVPDSHFGAMASFSIRKISHSFSL